MFPDRLIHGYEAFIGGRFAEARAHYERLAEHGQKPEILLIGCSDSRVAPEAIFDAGPGEMFVVRNVANLVPAVEGGDRLHGIGAALEFAVEGLAVKHIVVLGHARCGGVRAFVEKPAPLSEKDFIGGWVSALVPVAERLGAPDGGDLTAYEQAAIGQSLDNLATYDFVRSRVADGRLRLHGAYFDIANGRLLARDPESGDFLPASPACPAG